MEIFVIAFLTAVGVSNSVQPHTDWCDVDPLRPECTVRLSEADPRPRFGVDIGDPDDPSDNVAFEVQQ